MTYVIHPHDAPPRTFWTGGAIASVLFHLGVVAPWLIHFSQPPDAANPAAVMVEYSDQFEVSIVKALLPPGVSQQRNVEAMAEEHTANAKEMPEVLRQDDAEIKLAAAKREQKRQKKVEHKKKAQRKQEAEKGNSTATSLAAPPVQTVQTQRNAAPLDTDSTHLSTRKMTWESLVKGKINRQRNYPDDARRRKRTGTAVIAFSVNAHGEVVSSQLVSSSGTISLDRAALLALESARPLPPPPEEILLNGIQKVTLPVEFGLVKI
ncbi:TonB family protein [Enterobacter sp.]|uniref:TonB family protein n=1 Tax=Enterobacter sp. TaxID=42895 RepID=UPI00296FED04|nr:TonB family protein [Enterobacter sp.]